MPIARGQVIRLNATEVKNRMGQVLDRVMQGNIVVITRHETPKAAVIPMTEFEKLIGATEQPLGALSQEYEAMLARMQTREARKAMKRAFDASPKELAQAALKYARKRG